jgi:hypothetical protein
MDKVYATSRLDLANAVDFLATNQRKERALTYHQRDYLGLKRMYHRSKHNTNNDKVVPSTLTFEQRLQTLEKWEISVEGRMQVGHWFFKSE